MSTHTSVFSAILTLVLTLTSCSSRTDVADSLENASIAIADSDWTSAQSLCDGVFSLLATPDSTLVSERQAGELAILYMKLSEQRSEEENRADATRAFRYAYRLSKDSLHEFSATLPLEDQRHYDLLYRICFSIDNPVDLMDLDAGQEGHDEEFVE